jgi:hypothetical protein
LDAMGFRKIAFVIIGTLACGSAALAGGGGHGTFAGGVAGAAGSNRSNGATLCHLPSAASNTTCSCVYRHRWIRCVNLPGRLSDTQQDRRQILILARRGGRC